MQLKKLAVITPITWV